MTSSLLPARFVPLLAACAGAALAFALGLWQGGLAFEREARHARIQDANRGQPAGIDTRIVDPQAYDQRRVAITGVFVPEATIFLDNRAYRGAPGVHVLTPLRLAGGSAVVVNRGWMPAPARPGQAVAPPPTPAGAVSLEGVAMAQVASGMALRGAATGKLGGVWPNFSFAAYANETGLVLQPVIVHQTSAVADGLVRDWPAAGAGHAKHVAYAILWFAASLASLAFGLRPFVAVRRRVRSDA